MRVLVTGAAGFIGRAALATLKAQGADVHAADLVAPQSLRDLATWHRFDVLTDDPEALARAVRATHLLHLAWITTPGVYPHDEVNREWAAAGLRLAEAFIAHGGRRIVAAGSCLEYAPGAGVCDEEHTPIEPASLYGQCKHQLHRGLRALSEAGGVPTAWGRVFFLYGPHEKPDRLVPAVIRSLLRSEPAACSEGTQERDFLHVQDVADAFVALLASDVEGAVNIGAGTAVAVRDVALAIGRALGREDLVHLGARPSPEGEPPLIVAAPGRMHGPLGFRPRYDLESGLAATIAWWRAVGGGGTA